MAPADNLSPPGSSTYSSNTMYVGDGTWDATRNDFLMPNLVGMNFETMRYNGMGNRFAGLPQYHQLIKGHGVVAVICFLFVIPIAILMAQFYHRSPFWALRIHIYLQILAVALSTVVFTLGWFAVGPERSLTNPHHGIGTAIYVLILVQALGGCYVRSRAKKRAPRKLPVTLVLHQWIGRAIALLGFAQIPLGLVLYGSPKFTFVLYSVWMFFLLVLYFVLSYRALPELGLARESSHGGTVIEDRKPSRLASMLGPLAAGAGAAALLSSRRRSQSESRRTEVIPSRRGSRRESDSYVEDEKFEERRKEGGGVMDKLLKGAAVLGAAGLAKSWYDRRQRRKQEDEYSSVAPDTPSRRNDRRRRNSESDLSESVVVNRMEEGRPRRSNILPGPGDPVAAAAAISAAEARPTTPAPVTPGPMRRRDSYDSESEYYDSTVSPSRRPQSTHGVRNGLLAGLGLGFIAKKMKDRRDRKELERLDRIEAERIEEERRARQNNAPGRHASDGFPAGRKYGRRGSLTQSSFMSSIDDPHGIRPGAIPPIPAALAAGGAGAGAGSRARPGTATTGMTQSVSRLGTSGVGMSESVLRHDGLGSAQMPPAPPDPHGILHQSESGSEAYASAGGHPHRRHSSRRRKEGEAAAAIAGGAAALALEEEARRKRSRSRAANLASESGIIPSGVASPPVSVKVKVHDDKDRHVTLRRLTEEEAAAEREARRTDRRRRRADSVSSLSGTDTAGASRQRFRRSDREAERMAESSVHPPPPPRMAPLSPPSPAFASGKKPKDSAYYSGRPAPPAEPAASQPGLGVPGSVGSESHGTWSALSPSVSGTGDGADVAAERRRRRRLERSQRDSGGPSAGGVEFS